MAVNFLYFPGGRKKALTLSYDDGVYQDVKLIEIMDKYKIKGTFHLNGGLLGTQGRLGADEIVKVYGGHEIAAHGLKHLALSACSKEQIMSEIAGDREVLEKLTGKIVRGMSYAYGAASDFVAGMLRYLGVEYSRLTQTTGDFYVPEDFLKWRGTCHHNEKLLENAKRFIQMEAKAQPQLFYIWGHSYEFDRDGNWDMFKEFCETVGGRDDIWYATNIEICDYISACKSLRFSADLKKVLNNTAIDVFIDVDGETVKVPAGVEMVI